MRGPNGESASAVLSQVTDANRYSFDQACRVQSIRGALDLHMQPGIGSSIEGRKSQTAARFPRTFFIQSALIKLIFH